MSPASMTPSFQVSFGTAIVTSTCEPNAAPPVCSTAWGQLNILLTPEPNGCPARWIDGYGTGVPSELETTTDVSAIWLAVQAPNNAPYPNIEPSFEGTYQVNSSEWDTGFIAGMFGPFIVSAFLPKGTDPGNGFAAVGADGLITITKFAPNERVAGSFDATFGDGTHVVASFDVPICTTACFQP